MFALRIGSRPSRLALAQAELVRERLGTVLPGLDAEIVPIKTSGDRIMTPSLAGVGGKGLFIKELEQALSERKIDIAVHSMKDLPAQLAPVYRVAAVPERENPRDALVTQAGDELGSLRAGARLGTSSARRKFQAIRANPGLEVIPLRGNADTRLARVRRGEFDAIILAVAGLRRLGLAADTIFRELDEREFVPAAAQGAIAIEGLAGETVAHSAELEQAVSALNDPDAAVETAAERAFLAAIGASCVTPVGVKSTYRSGVLAMRTILFSPDGSRELSEELAEPLSSPDSNLAAAAGARLGNRMLARGAGELLG